MYYQLRCHKIIKFLYCGVVEKTHNPCAWRWLAECYDVRIDDVSVHT
jgi:hypothetical protein